MDEQALFEQKQLAAAGQGQEAEPPVALPALTIQMAKATYEEQRQALMELRLAEGFVLEAERSFKAKRYDLVAAGLVVGRNDGERDACAAGLLATENANLYKATAHLHGAKLSYELVCSRVEELRLILRLLEYEQGAHHDPGC